MCFFMLDAFIHRRGDATCAMLKIGGPMTGEFALLADDSYSQRTSRSSLVFTLPQRHGGP